ncbi:MAG TPA: DctP family TRAP transporter solute-binding subunit [Candidatus Sulfotelmatobacter sp.]|nr:DctP family TRAP transporter solute-binding subunit [Candidatus Sulfotelmatobacter sp.]
MRTRSRMAVAATLCFLMLSGLLLVGAMPVPAAQIELKLGHADPADVYTSRKAASSTVFKQMVESETGGAVSVKLFPAGQAGGERDLAEATKLGTMQAAMLSGPFSNFCKEVQVLDIPYLFSSYMVAWKVLDGPFGKDLAQECLKKTGMRVLTYGQVGFRNFTNSARPIKSPADLKGMKVRVMESPVYMSLIRSLGGAPTPVPWTETYTALQQKVVDAQENPVSSIKFAKLYEVQKYLTLDGHTYGVSFMLMNEKFFQSLPKDVQAVVKNAAATANVVENGIDTLDSSLGIQFLRDKGMEIYVPTPKEKAAFRDAAQKPIIEYLEKQIGRPWIDKVLAAVKDAEAAVEK